MEKRRWFASMLVLGAGLLAPAWALAAVPLVLPSGEVAADWERLAAMGGLDPVPAAEGAGPRVIIVADGGRWRVEARDARGAVRVVHVAPPRTEAEREDLVWVAQSLLYGTGGAAGAAPASPATPAKVAPSKVAAKAAPAKPAPAKAAPATGGATTEAAPVESLATTTAAATPSATTTAVDVIPGSGELAGTAAGAPTVEPAVASAGAPTVEPAATAGAPTVEPAATAGAPSLDTDTPPDTGTPPEPTAAPEAADASRPPLLDLDVPDPPPPPPPPGLVLSVTAGVRAGGGLAARPAIGASVGLDGRSFGAAIELVGTPEAAIEPLGGERAASSVGLRALGSWRPLDTRVTPVVAVGAGLSVRSFSDAGAAVAWGLVPELHARAGVAVAPTPWLVLEPTAGVVLDARPTRVGTDPDALEALPLAAADLALALRFSSRRRNVDE